jgi:hypothetical protein
MRKEDVLDRTESWAHNLLKGEHLKILILDLVFLSWVLRTRIWDTRESYLKTSGLQLIQLAHSAY